MGKFMVSGIRILPLWVGVVVFAIEVLVLFGGHATARTITVDGNPSDWAGISPTLTSTVASKFRSLSVTNDSVFVYFLVEFTSDRFTGCSRTGSGDVTCPFITLSLDPDLNGTFKCEPGIAIGINLDPNPGGNPGVGRIKGRDNNNCGFGFDFPGAITAVGSGRFIEASVSLSVLKQIAPSLTSFDILVWDVSTDGPIPDTGRYVIQTDTPPSVPPRLTLSVNERAFSAGDPLRVGLLAVNPGPSFNADFYFGYLMPDGVTAFFLTSLAPLNGVMVRVDASPANFKPLAANVLIPQGLNVALDDVFVFTFSGSDPKGAYVFFAFFTPPNAFADGRVHEGDILAVYSKAFTVQPPPSPGWYRNSGAGGTASIIYEDSTWRIVWENSYIYQHPGTDNLYWYAQVRYLNKSSQSVTLTCSGLANPSLDKEHIRGTEGIPPDGDGYVAAEETFCSRNPDFTASIDPGGTHDSWAIFHNVPPSGEVSLEWGSGPYGRSAWVNPWYSRFSAPPPAECPPELVALGTCYPVSRTPEGKAPNLIVLVHGCCTDANDVINVWDSFGRQIAGTIQTPGVWEIVVWDWSKDTPKTGPIGDQVAKAYNNAFDQSLNLSYDIAQHTYKYIHLIGHSAGARLIDTAAKRLIEYYKTKNDPERPFIHLTFLDAYQPNDDNYGFLQDYPKHYAEHYVDRTPSIIGPLTNSCLRDAFNFDITKWIGADKGDPTGHQWPIYWYEKSVTILGFSRYGYRLSRESGYDRTDRLAVDYPPWQQCPLSDKDTNCDILKPPDKQCW